MKTLSPPVVCTSNFSSSLHSLILVMNDLFIIVVAVEHVSKRYQSRLKISVFCFCVNVNPTWRFPIAVRPGLESDSEHFSE